MNNVHSTEWGEQCRANIARRLARAYIPPGPVGEERRAADVQNLERGAMIEARALKS
jgi:hypothetical protein